MDVKYIPADWEKMRSGIGDLVGLGRWGKGMIDELKDITENLEDAESDISKYDSDGVISFSHSDKENKYQQLFDDFKVLYDFTGKVGDIVDRTIDEPFYQDIDAFVEKMRDATISNYTTKNRIGVTEEQIIYYGQGIQEKRDVPKSEVSLEDLFSGDTFYGEQMQIQYDTWKAENPDQDFSFEEYQMAAVNMNAFEYESIKDQQHNKEFWVNIAALVVIVGVSVVCPPAGLTLAAGYGALELGSAISGEDWASGRELDTGERWLRGALAPLDIVPGVAVIKKFSSGVLIGNQALDMGRLGTKSGIQSSIQRGATHVGNLVIEAGKQSTVRLKNAGAVVKDTVKEKLRKDAIEVARVADSVVTGGKNILSTRTMVALDGVGSVRMPAENTHFFEGKVMSKLGKDDSVGALGTKGTSNTSIPKPVRPKASSVKPGIRKKPSASKKQKEKRLSNAQLNKLVKDNFVKETSRTRTYTSETMPGIKDFAKWFNELSIDEFELAWATPKLRTIIESRIRYPGGYHEWHLVSRAPIFKRWGVRAEDIAEMRTLTKDVEFVNPVGRHGFDGSGKAHRELLNLIDHSLDYDTFKRKLRNWAHYRLKGGIDSLPEGLR